MASTHKCKNCGSADIEVDPARGDAVCTNCGSVLEVNIIVSEVEFEEGGNQAVGQFVWADSKGGGGKFGASFQLGSAVESRELTLRKARQGISHLCHQLQLNQHCIDTACSFFKMALTRNIIKGHRNAVVYAACVYLTCRTEGTAHLLIDVSDALQLCCYQLGRTYSKLAHLLCINIPVLDPCIYILRFAAQLQFGPKTQQVSNTAMRLVQRMKKDSIHSGRRPSGLCGAALLIAARLHDFGRTISDIVKVVKIHETTLRKRLMEFGDTPSSSLTLDEFMTVDLEEEQDPPSFKMARKKDKDRLQQILEEDPNSITDLQQAIESQLLNCKSKRTTSKSHLVGDCIDKVIEESTLDSIKEIIHNDHESTDPPVPPEIGPDYAILNIASSLDDTSNAIQTHEELDVDLTFDDVDDDEIDMYILTDPEFQAKNDLWTNRNAAYIEEQKLKNEKRLKEQEEGKPEKKKRKSGTRSKRNRMMPTTSAGEAIERVIQEKKVSSKINYEVLRNLNVVEAPNDKCPDSLDHNIKTEMLPPNSKKMRLGTKDSVPPGLPLVDNTNVEIKKTEIEEPLEKDVDEADDYDETESADEEQQEGGLLSLLRRHRNDEEDNDDYYGYEEEY